MTVNGVMADILHYMYFTKFLSFGSELRHCSWG